MLKDIEKDKVLLGNAIDSKTPDDMMLYPNIPSPMGNMRICSLKGF